MPVLVTDLAPPTDAKLAFSADRSTRQFWDPRLLLSSAVLRLGREHLDRLPAAERHRFAEGRRVAWDLVLLFPPGARWDDELPWPSYADGPVVDMMDELSRRLGK
jgi:hypothetical protein